MNNIDKRSFSSPINGQKGGVKTEKGKNISSMNSLKHGILANFSTSFDDQTFEETYKVFAEEFGDNTPSRQMLISQLSILHIRLRRCARFESEFMRYLLKPPKYEKKLIQKGIGLDLDVFNDQYETVLVDSGESLTIDPEKLSSLENIYLKYETQFLSRFCHIIEILTQK